MSFKRGVKFNGVTLSSGYIVLRHRIEVMNCLDMSGQTVTASVKVLHDFGSSTNFKIGLRKPSSGTADSWGSGSSLTSVSDVNVAVPSASTTVVSGTWTLNSTDADLGLEIVVYCDPVSVTTKNVVIGDIQLTLGSDVEQIERRSYGNELHLCQRYFWPYIFGDSAGQTPGPIGWGETTTTFLAPVQFPQSMRAAPVISTTNAAADFRARYGNASIPCSAVPYGVNTNTMGCWLFGTVASGITVNGIYALSGNASNVKLNFSAEL
jgi:hypothetical protein